MLLAVRISSYGCTWEVWRALKKLELLSAAPRATLTHFSCSPNFPRAPITSYTHANMNKFLTLWLECDLTSGRLANIGISTKRRDAIKEPSILSYLRPFVVTTLLRISPFRNIQLFSTQPSPNPAFLL